MEGGKMSSHARALTARGITLFVLASLLALVSLGDQGCSIRIGAGPGTPPPTPPPPPGGGTGPTQPTTTTAPPPTTAVPLQVAILSANVNEVTGVAADTADLTSTFLKVELLGSAPASGGTTAAPPTLLSGDARSNDIPGLTYANHGFRFRLNEVPADLKAQVAEGKQVAVRASKPGAQPVVSSPATIQKAPAPQGAP
jgi:hypothetical protein